MTDKPKLSHACDLVKESDGPTCPAGLPVPRGTVLTRRTLRSVAILVVLGLLVTGVNLLWTAHAVNSFRVSQRQEQVAQRRQGLLVERRLCTTLGRLAALTPPPGDPASNPSRAYLQAQHDTLAQLGTDLGCSR